MWNFELFIQANACVSLRKLKWLSHTYLQYKTYAKTHTFNDLHQGFIEIARSRDKFLNQRSEWDCYHLLFLSKLL